MRSHLTADFCRCFEALPERVQRNAREGYTRWKADPAHPSLHFKKVHRRRPIYAVRVGIGWRALGVRAEDAMIWFWIGSHADYDRLLKQL